MAEALVNAFTVAGTEGELMSMLNCMDVKRRGSGDDVVANRVVGSKVFYSRAQGTQGKNFVQERRDDLFWHHEGFGQWIGKHLAESCRWWK